MDPFHDLQIQHLRGWPDMETAPSVIRCVKQSMTVKALSAGNTILVYTWPILNYNNTHYATRRNAIIDTVTSTAVSTDFPLSMVTINQYDGDQATVWGPTNPLSRDVFSIDPDFIKGNSRVIGMGVEVHDVTAELYKQGTCTTFQVPQSSVEPEVFMVRPQTISENGTPIVVTHSPFQGYPLKPPPRNLAEAMYLEGTRQWDAAQGAYTVVPFQSRDNFAGQPTYAVPCVYRSSNLTDVTDNLNTGDLSIGDFAHPIITNQPLVFLANKYAPVHSKGIALTGLNENSTFTINCNVFIETFPSVEDYALVTLARPSASRDEVALEIISRATQNLPIAVPVGMNGIGEWFAEVVAEVGPWVSAAAMAFGQPEIAALSGLATEVATKFLPKTVPKVKKNTQVAAPNSYGKPPTKANDPGKQKQKQPSNNTNMPKLSEMTTAQLDELVRQAGSIRSRRKAGRGK